MQVTGEVGTAAAVLEGLGREANWAIGHNAAEGLPSATCKGPPPSQRGCRGGAEGCYYTHRGDGISVSIFRALKTPSFLILPRLKPSQNGVDARSDRNMLVRLDLNADLVAGSEWTRDVEIQDFAGGRRRTCRTRCHCLTNRPQRATCARGCDP